MRIFAASAGCKKAEKIEKITQLSIITESGSILPELKWHEEFTIQQNSITFTRTGMADSSDVNTGSWQVLFDSTALADLYETHEDVDLSKIDRIEPVDKPDGGGSEFYQLTYANNKTWSLEYALGATYTNGEKITQPVQDFIDRLILPTKPQIVLDDE